MVSSGSSAARWSGASGYKLSVHLKVVALDLLRQIKQHMAATKKRKERSKKKTEEFG